MFTKTILTIICLCLCACPAFSAKDITIVPWPKTVKVDKGGMPLSAETRIVINKDDLQPLAAVLAEELFLLTSLKLKIVSEKLNPGDIALAIDPSLEAA